MDVYLIRHADALALGSAGATSDAERPLSDRGRKQSRQLAATLQRLDICPAKILSSPLLRARQTAEEMLRHWSGPRPEWLECEELAPGVRPRRLAKALQAINESSVALIGHQPDLGVWTAWVIGSKKAHIDFDKAGVAYVACSDEPRKGAGILAWLVTPQWF